MAAQLMTSSSADDTTSLYNVTDNVYKDVPWSFEHVFNDVVGVWLTGVTCLLGLTGNILSFIVLQRAFGSLSPMFHVLRAMSVSDAVFLLVVFVAQTSVNVYPYIGLLRWANVYRGYIQYAVWPVLMTTQVNHTTGAAASNAVS